jgi:predicted TIM-barrel enzyme
MSSEKSPFLEATVESFHKALQGKKITSASLVKWYVDRIQALNNNGPRIQAIGSFSFSSITDHTEKKDGLWWNLVDVSRVNAFMEAVYAVREERARIGS